MLPEHRYANCVGTIALQVCSHSIRALHDPYPGLLELQESKFGLELTNPQNVNMCHDRMCSKRSKSTACVNGYSGVLQVQSSSSGEDQRHHPLTGAGWAEMFSSSRDIFFLQPFLPLCLFMLSIWSRTTTQFIALNRGVKSKYFFCLL